MGLFGNKKQSVNVRVTVRQQEPEKKKKPRKLTREQEELLKRGCKVDSRGYIWDPHTVWIPQDDDYIYYHSLDLCDGQRSGVPYPESEAVRQGRHRCPYCFDDIESPWAPARSKREMSEPLGRIEPE